MSSESRWRRQKYGLLQGSVLAPSVFNIYTNDQPSTQHPERWLYADDLALATQTKTFDKVEKTLTSVLDTLGKYYDSNALRPNSSKTYSCAFLLRDIDANRTLNITWRESEVVHCTHP